MSETTRPVMPVAPRRGGRAVKQPQRPPRTLSRTAIIEAALVVLDAEGLTAVTMRRVAEQLGTGPASLYAHFADKEEMVDAVFDRVASEVPLPDPIRPEHWQDQLKTLLYDVWATFRRHRDISRVGLGKIPTGEGALRAVEAMLALMLAGGVSAEVAGLSIDVLALYVTASAFEDSLGTFPTDEAESVEFHREMGAYFAALPAGRFPHLVAMAAAVTTPGGDERFEFGLDLLIRGIASTVALDPPAAAPR